MLTIIQLLTLPLSLVTGIDNHQLCSIKIGTVGAYTDTQPGPAILIMHQYAIHQAH
jgi:hypothetical protein